MKGGELTIDIKSYWHVGAGRVAGAVLDAVMHRDPAGLPVLPGRHLKGLLRDALERAEAWDWAGYEGAAARLFGDRAGSAEGTPQAGCLRVSDARLPSALADWLATDQGKGYLPGLFRALYSTAVNHDTGVACDKSLRGFEVAVPLELVARVEPIPGRTLPDGWFKLISDVLPLVDAVGAHRNRGLGRAALTWQEVVV